MRFMAVGLTRAILTVRRLAAAEGRPDPEIVLGADPTAVALGASPELRGSRDVAKCFKAERGHEPARIDPLFETEIAGDRGRARDSYWMMAPHIVFVVW
jgi:hypothetical protein